MRRIVVALIVLVMFASPVLAWEPAREGPNWYTGGGPSPLVVNPAWYTAGMNANHHVPTRVAQQIARALARGAPIISAISGRAARVYWSPEARRVIVLLDDGRNQVWKFVYAFDPESRAVRFVTNFRIHRNGALRKAIARLLAEGAYRIMPPYVP